MTEETIFARIIRKEIPADIVYEDDICVAFRDIAPKAPTHVLIVPRRPLTGLQDATAEDRELLGGLLLVARKIAAQEGILKSGFRCIINSGRDGGQEIPHLHIHLLGGNPLGPMIVS